MIYQQLFSHHAGAEPVRAGVIGTGQYATAVVTQSPFSDLLDVPVSADLDVEAARQAYLRAGYSREQIVICDNHQAAAKALEAGKRVVVPDALLALDLPLDVIVEATGIPEAGALHAREAIARGKHVAMVNKETDAVVGPMLKRLADQAGVVYSAVDGDQHGLLMGMVSWARTLGLEVLCAGEARNASFVYDPAGGDGSGSVMCGDDTVELDSEGARVMARIPAGLASEFVRARGEVLASLGTLGGYDMTEMAIAANATGLLPDTETLHCPIVRTLEIPEVLCPREDGGLLALRGAIEVITCLHHADEVHLGGGIFMVVSCANDYSRHIITSKGCYTNGRDTAALLYRPYHLCGVETSITVLCAALLGVATGATKYLPRVDVCARATRDLAAGEVLGNDHSPDHSPDLETVMLPAQPLRDGNLLPLHVGTGLRLVQDVAAGTLITTGMVGEPEGSVLWTLRREQDASFL